MKIIGKIGSKKEKMNFVDHTLIVNYILNFENFNKIYSGRSFWEVVIRGLGCMKFLSFTLMSCF